MLMLIHPDTGDVQTITKETENANDVFVSLLCDGYNPVGPRAKQLALRYRTRDNVSMLGV